MSKIILFQGDSITDGNRYKDKASEWDLNHQMGHGYAFMVNAILGSVYPEKDLRFVNKGISGNRSVDIYARIQEDILNIKPDILSLLMGVNDVGSEINNACGTDAEKFEKIYRLIIEETAEKLPDAKFILMEPFILPVKDVAEDFDRWDCLIKPKQTITKKLAEEYKLIYVPLQEKFNELSKVKEAAYWIWDGVHPTVCGHGVIANEWIKAVSGII